MDLSVLSEEELRNKYLELPSQRGRQQWICKRYGVQPSSLSRWTKEKCSSPTCANAIRLYFSELESPPVADERVLSASAKTQNKGDEHPVVLLKNSSSPASLPPRNLRTSQTPASTQSKDTPTCKHLEKYQIDGMAEKEPSTAIL